MNGRRDRAKGESELGGRSGFLIGITSKVALVEQDNGQDHQISLCTEERSQNIWIRRAQWLNKELEKKIQARSAASVKTQSVVVRE